MGAYTCLNSTTLACEDRIEIGEHCLFAWGSVVTDSIIPSAAASIGFRRGALFATAGDPRRRLRPMASICPVRIEDNVWVGFDSVICGGVTIGRGAIIGCKTVITEDVPPYAIVAGAPPAIVRYLAADDSPEAREEALRTLGLL